MLYLHHVPGRLRLRLAALKGNGLAATRACAMARAISGVTDVQANEATGSLVIRYDPRRLTPDALWAALCENGLVGGPSPITNGTGPTFAEPSPAGGGAEQWHEILARAMLDRFAQHLASALVSAFV
jgi:hypothetical protein